MIDVDTLGNAEHHLSGTDRDRAALVIREGGLANHIHGTLVEVDCTGLRTGNRRILDGDRRIKLLVGTIGIIVVRDLLRAVRPVHLDRRIEALDRQVLQLEVERQRRVRRVDEVAAAVRLRLDRELARRIASAVDDEIVGAAIGEERLLGRLDDLLARQLERTVDGQRILAVREERFVEGDLVTLIDTVLIEIDVRGDNTVLNAVDEFGEGKTIRRVPTGLGALLRHHQRLDELRTAVLPPGAARIVEEGAGEIALIDVDDIRRRATEHGIVFRVRRPDALNRVALVIDDADIVCLRLRVGNRDDRAVIVRRDLDERALVVSRRRNRNGRGGIRTIREHPDLFNRGHAERIGRRVFVLGIGASGKRPLLIPLDVRADVIGHPLGREVRTDRVIFESRRTFVVRHIMDIHPGMKIVDRKKDIVIRKRLTLGPHGNLIRRLGLRLAEHKIEHRGRAVITAHIHGDRDIGLDIGGVQECVLERLARVSHGLVVATLLIRQHLELNDERLHVRTQGL